MNNAIDTNDNDSDNTNILADKSADNTIDNNSASRLNSTICNRSCKRKSLNAYGDKPALKQAKVTGSHILAESIIAIVKEMQASQEER